MKRLALLFTVLVSLFCTDCAAVQQWWQQFQQDPIAQVQTFETDTQIVVSNATTAFNVVMVFLPPAVAQVAQQQFNNAVASVNHALLALQALVQAAVDAKNNFPDFSAAILDVSNAVQQVVAIVATYKTQQVQPASAPKLAEPPGFEDAQKGLVVLQHFVVKVH